MLLSTYRRRRYERDIGDYGPARAEERPLKPVPIADTQGNKAPDVTVQPMDPLLDFDEYGTELHRDARVWKVYVKETDKYDADLVKGWNDSTDVILIFAALFSAISTAFLIESSKMLQTDPAEVSAQALLTISQTLLTIANGTQSAESLEPSPNGSADFVPSHTAVCVNTLWYLSLSLSLATSFIAILSKDWCHSFMAARTGHPYPQTLRRQRKWDMLERWKMAELLAVLPSMIHVALLLFSVGLCILLWETHRVVALPVICVTGVAFSFYIWSSVAAVVLDWFPYPTIVSKICRTEIVRHVARVAAQVVSQVAAHLIHNFKLLCLSTNFVILRAFQYLLYVPAVPVAVIDAFLEDPLDEWHQHLKFYPLPLRLLAEPLYWLVFLIVWKPANKILGWLGNLLGYLHSTGDSIKSQLSKPKWRLEWEALRVSKLGEFSTGQSNITSLAISWLIKNCEVPQSVDIALQSIAGAGKGFAYEPLSGCNAAVEISKRLASSSVYRSDQMQKVVLLYSRALSFLSSAPHPDLNSNQQGAGDDLEVMIWNLQTLFENKVAGLIIDGQFIPTPQNLAALQIGNTAASQGLKLMKDDHEGPGELFAAITQLMTRHLAEEPLHLSALLSLVNAASLLSLLTNNAEFSSVLPSLCIRVLGKTKYLDTPLLRSALVTCAILQSKYRQHEKVKPSTQTGTRYITTEQTIQALIDLQAHNGESANIMAEFGLEELMGMPADYYLASHTSSIDNAISWQGAIDINSAAATLKAGTTGDTVQQCLQALCTTYKLVRVGTPYAETYEFVLALICGDPSSRSEGWKIFSKFRFPKISRDRLTRFLGKYSITDSLAHEIESGGETMCFFAAGQLWLLFSLCILDNPSEEGRGLLDLLKKYAPAGIQGDEARHQHLGELMEGLWESSRQLILGPLGLYAYRLMECVCQWRHCPISQEIHDGLRDIPQELRGLSSFLDSWGQPVEPEGGRAMSTRSSMTEALNEVDGVYSLSRASPMAKNVEQSRASNSDEDIKSYSGVDKDAQDGRGGCATGPTVSQSGGDLGDRGPIREVADGPRDDTRDGGAELGEVGISDHGGGGSANSIRNEMNPGNQEHGEGEMETGVDNALDGPGDVEGLGGPRGHIAIDMPKGSQNSSEND